MKTPLIVEKFLNVFDGYELAYGQHGDFKQSEIGKVSGRAQTIASQVPADVVMKHLDGTGNSLGIVPIKKNNKCKFAAIDIDIRHPTNPLIHTIEQIEEKVNKLNLPLVVCQSKSKGVHLYCFTKQEVEAELITSKLKEWAALIGYGSCEIFPKQTNRADEKDIGNWINIPYFDHENTIRYAINKNKPLSLEEFFEFVEVMRIDESELETFTIEHLDEGYNDAPPCLQTLATTGIEEGSRNNGMYNFAVYFRNKYPDDYEDKIMEANAKIFNPMLKLGELEGIMKAVRKKEFFFKCNEYPIVQYCNKIECKKRRFGIGSSHNAERLQFENLTQYISSDGTSRWYAGYQGRRIKFTTPELINQRAVMLKMIDVTCSIFAPMKQPEWLSKINNLLKNCDKFHDPVDASSKGQFKELLDVFLTEGVPGKKKSDLLKYNTYLDEKNNEIYFRSTNLFHYLKNKRFYFDENEIWTWINEFGCRSDRINISNKQIRVWIVPAPEFYKEEEEEKDKI